MFGRFKCFMKWHDYQPLKDWPPSNYRVCTRCGKNGWAL